jgi:hypothetical protein
MIISERFLADLPANRAHRNDTSGVEQERRREGVLSHLLSLSLFSELTRIPGPECDEVDQVLQRDHLLGRLGDCAREDARKGTFSLQFIALVLTRNSVWLCCVILSM